MNLVKLQDELKMLPLPILTAKSQGQDPQVPPWLATAVLNERMDDQKKAGMAQGAAQGEQPSINEQLNQKAGLMALQGQQQQQAQQQMMQQMAQAPQPAPENVPQPEQQPEPQMMAQGGLARLPVDSRMFDYRAGGIIGFSGVESSEVPEAAVIDTQRVEAAARAKKIKELQAKAKFLRDAGAPQAAQVEAELAALTNPPSQLPVSAPPAGLPSALPKTRAAAMPPQGNVQIPMSPELRAAMEADAAQQGIESPKFNFQGPRGSTATLTPQAKPAAPASVPPAVPPVAQAGLPAALPSGYDASLRGGIARAEAEQGTTPAQAKARLDELTPEMLKEQPGLAQLARLKQQQEQYTKSQEDRPYERLMAVLGAGGRGGLGSMGAGYLGAVQGERAADAAQAAYQDKVMTAVEAAQRGEATAKQKALIDMVEKGDERKAKAVASTITGAAAGFGAEMEGKRIASTEKIAAARDITDRRGQDLHLQAAKLTSAAADVRADKAEQAQKLAELRSLATSFQALIKEPIDPLAKPAEIEAAKKDKAIYRQDYEAVLAAIAKMSGNVSLQSGRGVAPTMDANRASQFKVIR